MKLFIYIFLLLSINSAAFAEVTVEQLQKLVASDREGSDNFGWSVAISGDYAIVGAQSEEHDEEGNNELSNSGSAYIFENISGTWTQVKKLVASDRGASDHFGWSVAISGDYAIVGANSEKHDAEGNNELFNSGSAYIFERVSGTWTQVQKIVASDREAQDEFGYSVSINGNNAIVGSRIEDEDPDGNNTLTNSGSAYIFERVSGTWTQVQKIVASDRELGDYFGWAVSINGDYVVVGARNEKHDVEGNNELNVAGSAYIFERVSGTWTQVQKIVASDRDAAVEYGSSVSISGNYIVVGALAEDFDEFGGNELTNAGATYLYKKNELDEWIEIKKIVSNNRYSNDWFGYSVSIDGNNIFVGIPRNSYDINEDNNLGFAGSAKIYNIIPETSPTANTPTFSNITTSSASYSVEVADGGASTTVTFEYGTATGDYSATTTSQTITGASTTSTINFNVTGLDANEQYFVRARAENSVSFSYSIEASFWTLTDEPTTHTNSFAQVGESNNSISFSFQSLNAISADGYILLRSSGNIENPVDGTTYSVDDNIGSTVVVGKITDANTTEFVLNNQQFQKSYTFKLVPFNEGDDPATTNYFITDAPTINAYTIPTLGEWGMMAFVGLMAFAGVFYVRKRIV